MSGTYCFDLWLEQILNKRPQLTGQMHDELIIEIKKGHREGCEKLLRDAIERVNEKVQLNTKLDIDVQFGSSYSSIH